jgi:hypothetical protein
MAMASPLAIFIAYKGVSKNKYLIFDKLRIGKWL